MESSGAVPACVERSRHVPDHRLHVPRSETLMRTSFRFIHPIFRSYDVSGLIQLILVPQYVDANISEILTCAPWNGLTGGVLVFEASGTVTLEIALHKKPMVVAYKMAPLTYFIVKRMITVPYCAMPNLLANKLLVPEFIQAAADPKVMSEKLLELLQDTHQQKSLLAEFETIHQLLKQNASEKSCDAVLDCLSIKKEQGKDGRDKTGRRD